MRFPLRLVRSSSRSGGDRPSSPLSAVGSTPEGPGVLGWRRTCLRFGVSNPIDAKKLRCRRRFLRYFPDGFSDERYLAWERDYKAAAHTRWKAKLSGRRFAEFLAAGQYDEVAVEALRIEARTNLLFSFEKMALRDAVKTASGARRFAEGSGRALLASHMLPLRCV